MELNGLYLILIIAVCILFIPKFIQFFPKSTALFYSLQSTNKHKHIFLTMLCIVVICLLIIPFFSLANNGPRTGVDKQYLNDILSCYDHCVIDSMPEHSLDLQSGNESYTYKLTYYGNTYRVTADLNLSFTWDSDAHCWRNTLNITTNEYLTFYHPNSVNGGYEANSGGEYLQKVNYIDETHIKLSFTQSMGIIGTYNVTVDIFGGFNPYYTSTANTINPSLLVYVDFERPYKLEFVVAPGADEATYFYLY